MSNQPLIVINEAQICYQHKVVLEDIHFTLKHGERIAVLGKSGAGKSTFLSHLYKQLDQQRNTAAAWIPQQLGLVEKLSAFHNVYMGQLDQHSHCYNLLNLIWPQAIHKKAIEKLLLDLQIEENMFRRVGELSGGQQQRVAIARAIYNHSPIILADEPVANLDENMAKKTLNAIIENSDTTVIALHDVDQALRFADRIIGLQQGKIIIDAAPDNLTPSQLQPLYEH